MSGQATCRWGRRHRQPADEKVTGDFPEWGKKRGVAWREEGSERRNRNGRILWVRDTHGRPFRTADLSLNLSQHFLFLNLFFFPLLLSFPLLSSNQLNTSPHCQERAIASLLSRLFIATECSPSSLFLSLAFLPLHTPSTSTVAPPVRSTHRSLLRLDLNQRA